MSAVIDHGFTNTAIAMSDNARTTTKQFGIVLREGFLEIINKTRAFPRSASKAVTTSINVSITIVAMLREENEAWSVELGPGRYDIINMDHTQEIYKVFKLAMDNNNTSLK